MGEREKDPRIISSLQRALDILSLFGSQSPELGITEIAKALNLHKSTAAGLVYTLQRNGYIAQNPENRRYHLGLQLIERAGVLLDQIEIRKIAMPELEHLRDWSSESVNLAILEENQVIYIERLLTDKSLGFRNHIGKRAWPHSTALGKAILSHLPPHEARAILESYPLEAMTANTITDIDALIGQFKAFYDQGYAIEREENEIGGLCISAPIHNHSSNPVAAVSVSFPLSRLDETMITTYGTKILEVARRISVKLGHHLEPRSLSYASEAQAAAGS
ncbi:MAG: IclR family transcriptional regulator [Chloroflexota bacterium]|nr:IclR family transcriptional regulator [Chloroflexota bacterium]MDE2949602.1 IclR family transcriptional regulator [Chloroflexota bacterium]